MKKLLAASALTACLMLATSCGADAAASARAVGAYELDRQAFANMLLGLRPEAEREALRSAVQEQVAAAVGTAELVADGSYTMRMAVPSVPEVNVSGTWKLDGDKLSLVSALNGEQQTQIAMFRDGVITLANQAGPLTIQVVFKKK